MNRYFNTVIGLVMREQPKQEIFELEALLSASDLNIAGILAEKQNILICHRNETHSYIIINEPQSFTSYIKAMTLHESNQAQAMRGGIAEPFKIRAVINMDVSVDEDTENWLNTCTNTVFLKKVHLNRHENNSYIYFRNCHFRSFSSFGNPRVEQQQKLHFKGCSFQNHLVIGSKFEFIDITNTIFRGKGLILQNITGGQLTIKDSDIAVDIQNTELKKLIISKCNIERMFVFRTFIDRTFDVSHVTLNEKGYLKIDELLHSGSGRINFDKINGRVELSEVNLSNTKVDLSEMSARGYDAFNVKQGGRIEYDRTLKNFVILHGWAKDCEDKKYYLDIEYMIGELSRKKAKSENVAKSGFRKWYNKIIIHPLHWFIYEKLLGYFCKWTNILFTILSVIVFFAVVYNLSGSPFTPIKSLYFSLITFTTVGYGDLSPDLKSTGLMLTAGIEGLLGVILISFLTVTIVRRYIK